MNLVIGVVICAAAVVIYAWAFEQHRRPVPARWTRISGLSSLLVIFVVMLMPAGIGALGLAVIDPAKTFVTMTVWGAALMAASVILAIWLTPRLVRQGRAGSAQILGFPSKPRGTPAKPRRKAA